jgi:CD109 antigen
MLLFAPDVFVARYLKETGQLKPEVMAKAETLMLTGYQRELTYRRSDGSFSAFGESDPQGSLWLTAFVLKTFAQAHGLIYIDEAVLSAAQAWIGSHQQSDGSFEPYGFVHHTDMLGGLSGVTALTAFVAIALLEAGDAGADAAVRFLESQLADITDAYPMAVTAYALALAGSAQAGAAHDALMALATKSAEGLSWGDEPGPLTTSDISQPQPVDSLPNASAAVETTAYASLALLEQGDDLNAGRAMRWLVSRRNAGGGFGSTQDTVVALQAMTSAAASSRADIDATVVLAAGDWHKEVTLNPDNADVMQLIEIPASASLSVEPRGSGQVVAQLARRYNVPSVPVATHGAFELDVQFDASEITVDDVLDVTATIRFTPPARDLPTTPPAGMVVLDVGVPTGFAPVDASLDALASQQPKLKRWDLAGRKVIFYINDMQPEEELTLTFQTRALYPVRAQATVSQVYAYYRPEWQAQQLGKQLAVSARRG